MGIFPLNVSPVYCHYVCTKYFQKLELPQYLPGHMLFNEILTLDMILVAQEVPNFLKYGPKNEEDRENSAKDGLKHKC
jgi:hypothetical protein